MINEIFKNGIAGSGLKNGVLTLIILGIYLNLFQTLQRRNLVIHWDSMSKESYWAFLLQLKWRRLKTGKDKKIS